MDRRQMISGKLHELLGSDEVHFQPPENVKLVYPCIIYDFNGFKDINADNGAYISRERYTVTHIYRDPDGHLRNEFKEAFLYAFLSRTFVKDNLRHDTYEVYI